MGSLVTGAMQAIGIYNQGHAAAQAAKYNAAMADQNAKIQDQNSTIASQSGQAQMSMEQRQVRALVGETKANEAASGVELNTGSSPLVQGSESSLGYLDALNVRTNATREAYGYKTQAINEHAESELDSYKAKKTEQGATLGAVTSFLGSIDDSATKFAKYQSAGGFG